MTGIMLIYTFFFMNIFLGALKRILEDFYAKIGVYKFLRHISFLIVNLNHLTPTYYVAGEFP